nr:NIPA-like protein 2 [Salvelinus alpinus]
MNQVELHRKDRHVLTYLLGIIISICGNFLISISLNIQKYAHMRQSQLGDSRPYYTSVLWWSGVVLMGVGELGNFAAYGFAPASLIAPLGCVSVIANPMACWFCNPPIRVKPFSTRGQVPAVTCSV